MTAIGWPAAIALGVVFLAVELLPVMLGTGERAIWDWSLLYVTFRFILLPLACGAHVILNLVLLPFRWNRGLAGRLVPLSSTLLTGGFLIYAALYPLPLFAAFW